MQLRARSLLLLALALAGAAFAQAPTGAHPVTVADATLYHHVGPSATLVDEELAQDETGSIWFTLTANGTTRLVAYLNVTPTTGRLRVENASVTLDAAANATSSANVSFSPGIADAGVVNMTYAFTGELYAEQNGTLTLVGPVNGNGAFTVDVGTLAPVPAPGGLPKWATYAGIALLFVVGIAIGVGMRQRAVRRRMNEGPRRSQVMREMELEKKLEKAKAPEQVAEIQQEIRQAEQVREKRRELQILEAKRADALKTLDLLKQRHEKGGLTKLQYDNMAAKKRGDLERIEAEIAEMERQDGGAAA